MAQFDSMIFTDEFSDYFVAHAKKYTKEQAVETMISEEWYLWDDGFRKPTINDVREQWCRYYVKPQKDYYEEGKTTGGEYLCCDKGGRGSFPVHVIRFNDLRSN